MATYAAVGGTLTTPWGSNGTVVKVVKGVGVKRPLVVDNTTGPEDAGVPSYETGNYTYEFSGIGYYAAGDVTNDSLDDVTSGTLTVPLSGETGSETWSGTFRITQIEARPDWTTGGQVPVRFSGIYSGAVTVAAVA